MLNNLKSDLKKLTNPDKAKIYQRFFKTGKGEYGEGDVFLGLNSSQVKDVAKKYLDLKLEDIQQLLDSKIHEHRMCALRILVYQFEKAPFVIPAEAGIQKKRKKTGSRVPPIRRTGKHGMTKKVIYNFYIKNSKKVNNWDLVDVTCTRIVGAYLLDKDRKILYKLAKSKNLWERRISIISTGAFIWKNDFKDAIKISKILLNDKHDLIYKAVGWMLREVGKRDKKVLIKFLNQYVGQMPRVMLRYSIEKFSEKQRKYYLNK